MADLYLRFKVRVENGDNWVPTCLYTLVITNRKQNKEQPFSQLYLAHQFAVSLLMVM